MEEPDKDFLNFIVEKFKKYGISEEIIRSALKEGLKQVLESILAQKQKKWDEELILEDLKEEFSLGSSDASEYDERLQSKKVY